MKHRDGRLAEEIRKIVSEMLLTELKDPRFSGMISVSAVDATHDLSVATIYVMVFGDTLTEPATPERKKEVLAAFNDAKGMIRHRVAELVQLRRVPELYFKIDESMEYGQHMEQVLDSLKK